MAINIPIIVIALTAFLSFGNLYAQTPATPEENNIELSKPLVLTWFLVDKNGKPSERGVYDISCKFCPDSVIQNMVEKSIAVLKKQPTWKVGRDSEGNPVSVKFMLPIAFKENVIHVDNSSVVFARRNELTSESDFEKKLWLSNYLINELNELQQDTAAANYGTLNFSLTVHKNGQIDSLMIVSSPSQAVSEALKDVLNNPPGWISSLVPFDSVMKHFELSIPISEGSLSGILALSSSDANKSKDEFYEKGVRYFQSKYYLKALIHFERAVEIDPTDLDALYNTAVCYVKLKNYPMACKYATMIRELGKPDADKILGKYCQQ